MKVFKFGGASLKDAAGIKNVASIIKSFSEKDLLVVVSAMGKTTNALEKIVDLSRAGLNFNLEFNLLKKYHHEIMLDLFPDKHPCFNDAATLFNDLERELEKKNSADQVYDQVVSKGEILSSIIVNHYLKLVHINSTWLDARAFICTDKNFREGRVNWQMTREKMQGLKCSLYITQGFIGSAPDGLTTTLGREGSDFSAAIFASCLEAESLTIWKDVPGVMSADPKRLPNAIVFDELPFKEAAEMTYYGASVIHPKTIKPLANKGIPLYVKNFDDPILPGTKIHECHVENLPPLIVFKENQCLISCQVTDYTFVSEQHLSTIFNVLTDLDVHINVMQNSAISFSFCIDFRESKVAALIKVLQEHFEVYYNTGLTLITIKNYDDYAFDTYRKRPGVLLEQSSRSTLQVLIRT
jgi:aspartate kinase